MALDGAAVVLDENGRPDFNALQNAFDRRSRATITLFLLDLLWLGGIDRPQGAIVHELVAGFGDMLSRNDWPTPMGQGCCECSSR
jgi:bifunctional non-homologous end joining protein LigD